MPLLIATWFGSANLLAALLFGPETKGKVFVPDVIGETAPAVRLAEAAATG